MSASAAPSLAEVPARRAPVKAAVSGPPTTYDPWAVRFPPRRARGAGQPDRGQAGGPGLVPPAQWGDLSEWQRQPGCPAGEPARSHLPAPLLVSWGRTLAQWRAWSWEVVVRQPRLNTAELPQPPARVSAAGGWRPPLVCHLPWLSRRRLAERLSLPSRFPHALDEVAVSLARESHVRGMRPQKGAPCFQRLDCRDTGC